MTEKIGRLLNHEIWIIFSGSSQRFVAIEKL